MKKNIIIGLLATMFVGVGLFAYTQMTIKDVTDATGPTEKLMINGLSFAVPSGWTVTRGFSEEKEPPYLLHNSEYAPISKKPPTATEMENQLKSGLEIRVGSIPVDVNSVLQSAELAQQSFMEGAAECSDCEQVQAKTLAGVPATFMVRNANDYGGNASYAVYYDGHIFSVSIAYTDTYKKHKAVFDEFLKSVTFVK